MRQPMNSNTTDHPTASPANPINYMPAMLMMRGGAIICAIR
jgi:hypothetical protein